MSVSVTLEGELLYPSNYIGAADLKGRDVRLTIENVQIDELMLVGGKKQKKPVLYFEKTPKMMVLNKTNATTIADGLGAEAKSWIGKSIVVYPTTTKCKGKTVPCVRVREVQQQRQVETAKPATGPIINTRDELSANLEGFCAEKGIPESDMNKVLAAVPADAKPEQLVSAYVAFTEGR